MAEHRFDGLRVLLVEDESIVAMLMEEMLEVLGCRVVGTVARVPAAPDAVNGHARDLAILDINVGGEPVYPFASLLAQRGIPFMFVTGYTRDELHAAFRDRPMLRKPFHLDELGALIRETLDRPARPARGLD